MIVGRRLRAPFVVLSASTAILATIMQLSCYDDGLRAD
jgi:hypothetical protein